MHNMAVLVYLKACATITTNLILEHYNHPHKETLYPMVVVISHSHLQPKSQAITRFVFSGHFR